MYYYLFLFCIFYFLQTDTTNTELKPLFGSSISKIESVFTEDNIESVPDAKGNSQTRPERTHAPTPTVWSYPIYLDTLKFQSLRG